MFSICIYINSFLQTTGFALEGRFLVGGLRTILKQKKNEEAVEFALGAATDFAKVAADLKQARRDSKVTAEYTLKLADCTAEQVEKMLAEARMVADGAQQGVSFGRKEMTKFTKDIKELARTTCILHSCTCQLRGDSRLIVSSAATTAYNIGTFP